MSRQDDRNGLNGIKKLKTALGMLGLVFLGLTAGLGLSEERTMAKDADGDLVIVIDAGHGGQDCGTKSTNETFGTQVLDSDDITIYEDDINLAIATAMRNELKQYEGVKVYLTRSEEDDWITNTGRAMIAREMKADFLISIHINSATGTDNKGALVIRTMNSYYAQQTDDMANLILDHLSALGLENRGVTTRADDVFTYEDYYTLIAEGVRVGVPSLIVEHCFLTNAEDALFVCNSDGSLNTANLTAMGVADAEAVVSYYGLKKRSAEADDTTTLTLAKGYSVTVTVPDTVTGEVTWYSIDSNIATVDKKTGLATAVNSGTTNIVYKLDSGESGFLTLEVEKTEALGLVGCLNPTFYSDGYRASPMATNFTDIKLANTFAVVIYNDGTSDVVTPSSVGTVNYSQIGWQDIPITYGDLSGYLTICHNTSEYIPEVTEAATEAETETQTETAEETTPEETTEGSWLEQDVTFPLKDLLLVGAILIALILIGLIMVLVESKKKRRRRGRRRMFLFFIGLFIGLGCASKNTMAMDEDGDIVIVVDAGHGSGDCGAAYNGVYEEPTNYTIALALKAELQTYSGVKVYLTRGSAEYNSNSGRAMVAKSVNADFVISCHNNANTNTEPNGVEVYTTMNAKHKAETERMADLILDAVSACGLTRRYYYARAYDQDPTLDYYTLIDEANRKADVPGLIIEHCFLSNASDAAFIAQTENQYRVGAADATAIATYYGLSKRTMTAGQSMTLTRTYSVQIADGTEGSYVSDDAGVAYVQSNGLVTAVSQGTTVIHYTAADGSAQSVTIEVPAVYLKAISAAINPTFYSDEGAIRSYDRNRVMVKALYSDGSAVQVSDVTFGEVAWTDTNNCTNCYTVPVSYAGKSCSLYMYVDSYLCTKGTSTSAAVSGTNRDILLIPGSYQSVSNATTQGQTITGETTAAYVAPTTAETTAAPTESTTVTEEETTPEETTPEETTPEETTPEETTPEETTSDETTEAVTETESETEFHGSDEGRRIPVIAVVAIGLAGVATAGAVVYFTVLAPRRRKK